MDKIAMQHVIVAAHQPERRPIACRQNDHAQNTDLKHLSHLENTLLIQPRFGPVKHGGQAGGLISKRL
jgi:hypothetical protein